MKQRIELANDKYDALEKKFSESESRLKQLESEKQGFELEKFKLKEKVRSLEEKLAERQSQRLEELREKILTILSSVREATSGQIAATLGVGEQLVTFHLEELNKVHFVSAIRFYIGKPTIWDLAQEGRGYLVKNCFLT